MDGTEGRILVIAEDNCHLPQSNILSYIALSDDLVLQNGPNLNPMSRESHVSPLG